MGDESKDKFGSQDGKTTLWKHYNPAYIKELNWIIGFTDIFGWAESFEVKVCKDKSNSESEENVLFPAVTLQHRDDALKLQETAGVLRCHDPDDKLPLQKKTNKYDKRPLTSTQNEVRDPCCISQPFPTLRILRQSISPKNKEARWLEIQENST